MKEFFQGWRRKIGVVTLVMALVFMAGWVRSLVVEDELDFHDFVDMPYGSLFIDGLATCPDSLALVTYEWKMIVEDVPNPTPKDSDVPSSDAPQPEENGNAELQKDHFSKSRGLCKFRKSRSGRMCEFSAVRSLRFHFRQSFSR